MEKEVCVFWFRRDLRLEDNHGLFQALNQHEFVLPIFIFDKNILDRLEDEDDARVSFIRSEIVNLNQQLGSYNSGIYTQYGTPEEVLDTLNKSFLVKAVYTNHDYEPYAKERDKQISKFLESKGIQFQTFKDQVIFEKGEVLKDDGKPYTVFTPYSNKWKKRFSEHGIRQYNTEHLMDRFLKEFDCPQIPTLSEMGFIQSSIDIPDKILNTNVVKNYKDQRDFPAIMGTSRLSVHLRFGTVSIRQLVIESKDLSETWLNELIWREFYQMILWHFPQVVNNAFKPAYDNIPWINSQENFKAWCEGKTGYPIVDAGMRELKATGFMHNRVRMITSSFLIKHLLIDWRWGEAWFARYLLDFELASNNGGWQWAASSGCDAAPYFRVFNPYLQTKKFDPRLEYINKWVPELNSLKEYPKPIVEHDFARKRVLETYKKALNS
ncbi:MAG: deoxyribodipyrimidine photo-lyase [Bacteroidia bacterium]